MSALDTPTVAADAPAEIVDATVPVTVAEETYRRRRLGVGFWLAVAWLVAIVLAAALADLLPLKDPNQTFSGASRSGPSAAHWFGADNIGKDVFSRSIYGARRSLTVAFLSTAIGVVIGAVLGLISGYYRRGVDLATSALFNVILSIPPLVLLLTLIAFLAPPGKASPTTQTAWVIVGLAILVIPSVARVTRAQTMVWSDRDFVLASRTLGAHNKRIILREILPNVIPAIVSFALIGLAALMLAEAALAFFGVGDVTGVSWGLMIQNGRSQLDQAPHMVIFPALFMSLTIFSLNFVGDGLRSRSEVKEGGI
ncbi:ABC transporter permease [Desertimonas flava]|uniref:ABC transporter permease n=1 Tax=Desertimonas flava TaxID=2064846 RepID=UPI000E3472D1|nr:ABC transporter permease [Desertimonas flava]